MLAVEDIRKPNISTFRGTVAFGIAALVFEVLMLFMYGFFIDFVYASNTVFDGYGPFLVFALALMTLVGTSRFIQALGCCSPIYKQPAGLDSPLTF